METLPRKRRRLYLLALVLIFVIAVPLLALYASGYRLSSDLKVIKTGGIHVSVPVAGSRFYLDDEFVGSGSLFQKSFFEQNLVPGTYSIRIEKDDHLSWEKELEVFPTMITDASALQLSEEIEFIPIEREIEVSVQDGVGTGTVRMIENPRYEEIRDQFSTSLTGIFAAPTGATTTIDYKSASTTVYERGGIGLWLDADGLHAWWLEEEDEFPYVFCEQHECEREILAWEKGWEIRHYDFLPENNLFVVLERLDGIVITELDTRTPQNTQPVYLKGGAQFRIVDGIFYILYGLELYQVEV